MSELPQLGETPSISVGHPSALLVSATLRLSARISSKRMSAAMPTISLTSSEGHHRELERDALLHPSGFRERPGYRRDRIGSRLSP
jgi:hypothetical protein